MVRYEAVDEENISPVQETNLLNKKYKIKLDCAKSLAEVEVSFYIVSTYTDVVQDLYFNIILHHHFRLLKTTLKR